MMMMMMMTECGVQDEVLTTLASTLTPQKINKEELYIVQDIHNLFKKDHFKLNKQQLKAMMHGSKLQFGPVTSAKSTDEDYHAHVCNLYKKCCNDFFTVFVSC
jgi:hypothetical protein